MMNLKHFPGSSPVFKVGVGVPSHGPLHPDFGLCLNNLSLELMRRPIEGYGQTQLKILNRRASLLPKLRQEIVSQAIKGGLEWLLFIDSDQTFPSTILHQLVRHKQPVVACNIATKSIPASPTARKEPIDGWAGGQPVYTFETSKGLEKVWRVGCGVMLLRLDIFKAIKKPWFQIVYREETDDFAGEDWYLCEKLEAAGIPIYIDHDASWEIGHIGDYTYGHKDVVVVEDAKKTATPIRRNLF